MHTTRRSFLKPGDYVPLVLQTWTTFRPECVERCAKQKQ